MRGGSSKKVTVGYKYYLGIHMVLCHGPVDAITRIEVDNKTAWSGSNTGGQISINAPNLFGGEEREGGIQGAVDVDMGGPSQGRNSYLQGRLGSDIPAYRGVLSAVLRQVYIGLNPYLKRWAFWARRINIRQNGIPQWYIARAAIGPDMNPAHIIRECLTDPDWGMGYPEPDVDDASFTVAADQLHSEGMGMSLLWDRSAELDEFIGMVLKHIDGALYVDRITGRFTLKLARGGYNTEELLVLDEDSIERITDFKRNTLGELSNSVTVIFWDITTGKNNSITVQDIALAARQGATVGTTIQYPGFTNGTIASRVAARDLRALSIPLASCTIYANRTASGLNIGDVFVLRWARYGITQTVMRVSNVELGSLDNNLIKITCVEDVFSLSDAIYAAPPPSEWTNPITAPAPCPHHAVIEAPYWELVQRLGDVDAQAQHPTAGFIVASGVRPSSDAMSAKLLTNPTGSTWEDTGTVDFTPTAVTTEPVNPGQTVIAIGSSIDVDVVRVGSYALLGTEIVRVDSITSTLMTVGRGCLDTVPISHIVGTRIFFADDVFGTDGVEYATGETARIKLLPTTGQGTLAESSAPQQTVVITNRHSRPYPPGNLRFNGLAYPSSLPAAQRVTVSWAHRNRLQQTATILDTTAASIGPEAGTTYTLRLYDQGNTLRRTVSGMTGTSYEWAAEAFESGLLTTERTGITWTQSSVASGATAATASNMRDNNLATGTITDSGSSWIQADLGTAQEIGAIALAGGTLSTGATAALLNGANIQHSTNGSTWTTLQAVAGVTDDNGVNAFIFSPVTARYWRLQKGSAIGVTEFRFYQSGTLNSSVRIELESVRGGVLSHTRHNQTVVRA